MRAVPARFNNQRCAFLLDGFLVGFIGILFDKYRLNIIEVQPVAILSFYPKALTTIKINRTLTHWELYNYLKGSVQGSGFKGYNHLTSLT
jgi:hypothetical protein